MTDNEFRNTLDKKVSKDLDNLLKETKKYDKAISKAKDRSKAQLWVALAVINGKINKLNKIENNDNSIPKDELNKILKTLETL